MTCLHCSLHRSSRNSIQRKKIRTNLQIKTGGKFERILGAVELTLSSAHDLKKASMISKTRAYAVAWISNDPKNRQRTPVDKSNDTDPIWNHDMKFTLDEAALQQGRLFLEIAVCSGATFGDKEIGCISIPFNEFLNPATTSEQFATTEEGQESDRRLLLIQKTDLQEPQMHRARKLARSDHALAGSHTTNMLSRGTHLIRRSIGDVAGRRSACKKCTMHFDLSCSIH